MGFKARFTKSDISRKIDQDMKRFRKAIISRLSKIGEEFTNSAKDKTTSEGGFGDVTGNLRSSIGYIVVAQGEIVIEHFEKAKKGGEEGVRKGKTYARDLADKYQRGYALIVVAGMEYATKVESKGYDVISGSSFKAEEDLRKAMRKLELNDKVKVTNNFKRK